MFSEGSAEEPNELGTPPRSQKQTPASRSQEPDDATQQDNREDAVSPSLLSSPSILSSLIEPTDGSPVLGELSRTTLNDEANEQNRSRHVLAQRLSELAHRITQGGEIDEASYGQHIDALEKALAEDLEGASISSQRHATDSDLRSRGLLGESSFPHSPPSFFSRMQNSDLALSSKVDQAEGRSALEDRDVMSTRKVISEISALNEELLSIVSNLKARQEESEHVHGLLVERAERAAQRIIFLQRRISFLEDELRENDDDLQHLRISLKAVEIQMPPHPDEDLQRCISILKEDYKALKLKRVNRSSISKITSSPSKFTDSDVTKTT